MAKDCRADPVKCYNCGETGHLAKFCHNKTKAKVCFKCGQEGHLARFCPLNDEENDEEETAEAPAAEAEAAEAPVEPQAQTADAE